MLRSLFNFIKNHYILLTLYFYGIGFVYHVTFYWHFGVPVIYYFELLDIILYLFYVLVFLIIPITIGYVACREILKSLVSLYFKKLKKKKREKHIFYLGFGISTLFLPFICYLTIKINWYGVTSLVVWLYVIYNFINYLQAFPKDSLVFYVSWTGVLIFIVMLTARFKYHQVVDYDRGRNIYFYYLYEYTGGDVFSDGGKYVGETSTHLFVYKPENGKTLILQKSEMKQIRYGFNGLNF